MERARESWADVSPDGKIGDGRCFSRNDGVRRRVGQSAEDGQSSNGVGASFSPAWSCKELAGALCGVLVEQGSLKAKPAFIRTDREAKLAEIFAGGGLDGAAMASFDNAGPLEMIIRKHTSGETWVDQVVEALVGMLAEDVRGRERRMAMDSDTKEELAQVQGQGRRKGKGRGGGGGDECYNCGGFGHLARDCPESKKGKGGRDREERKKGGGGDQECYNCGGYGHMARDCPEAKKGKGGGREDRRRGGGGGDQECYNCGGFGHMARDCPEPRQRGKGKGKGKGR